MALITKEQLLGAKPPEEEVQIQELGGSVWVRGLTAAERDEWEKSWFEKQGNKSVLVQKNLRGGLVARCLIEGKGGKRMCTDADAVALGEAWSVVIDRTYAVCARLSGVTQRDEDELGKASGSDRPGASSSTSPAS